MVLAGFFFCSFFWFRPLLISSPGALALTAVQPSGGLCASRAPRQQGARPGWALRRLRPGGGSRVARVGPGVRYPAQRSPATTVRLRPVRLASYMAASARAIHWVGD